MARQQHAALERVRSQLTTLIVLLFPSALFGIGVYGFIFYFAIPLLNVRQAGAWPAIECRVRTLQIKQVRRRSHHMRLTYEYDYAGETHRSSRLNFLGGPIVGKSHDAPEFAPYRDDHKGVCYVNPDDPSEAVLDRGSSWRLTVNGLASVTFMLTSGGVGLLACRRLDGRRKPADSSETSRRPREREAAPEVLVHSDEPGAKVLRPGGRRIKRAVLAAVAAIVCITALHYILGLDPRIYISDQVDVPRLVFYCLFLVPCAMLVVLTVGRILALLNPRPILTVSAGKVPLGGNFNLAWELHGGTTEVVSLRICLEGRTEVRAQNAKHNLTGKTFYTAEVASVSDPEDVGCGTARVDVPADEQPSTHLGSLKVIWALHVYGRIEFWPRIHDEHRITVLPAKREP